MAIIPFGPIPPKKPKSKKVVLLIDNVEVYGWISCDEELTQYTEIFSTDSNGDYGTPPDDTYMTEEGNFFTTINGVIQ